MSDPHPHEVLSFEDVGPDDVDQVGGKGLSLALLTGAGLPVPRGFCVTCAAHRRLRGRSPREDAGLAEAILRAYEELGGGPVAVRSSATAEDSAAASFAGQQETVLGVRGAEALLDAVARCWRSLDSERALAYRKRQGIDESGLAMAVVVQRLVPSEVSGVLFTVDPMDPTGRRMLAEASWGLGESVVSGRVQPDRFFLDRDSGVVLDRQVSDKATELTPDGPRPVPEDRRRVACLDDGRLTRLAVLGREVEQFYGGPRDLEWAWAEGQLWLLQARPITTVTAAEREAVRQEEMAHLRDRAEPGGTVWARFNLAEILPDPTPLTWAIVRGYLMAGQGGFGLTYHDLGYRPDPSLDEEGVYDLVCGRPYCNLSREPRLYARGQPLGHSYAELKAAPHKALYPRARHDWSRAGWKFWLFGPIHTVRNLRFEMALQATARSFAERLRRDVLPAFAARTEAAAGEDWSGLSDRELVDRFELWANASLRDFARDSLKATVLAAVCLGKVEYLLQRSLGLERTRAALGELVMGVHPDPEADLPGAIRDLAAGRLSRSNFLARFGHRGPHEMELAQPRWAEEPEAVDKIIARGPGLVPAEPDPPAAAWDRIAREAKLSDFQRRLLDPEVKSLHDYLALRETGKHYLMRGYALVRRALVELDRRRRLEGGIFYLTPGEELHKLIAGEDQSGTIAARRRRRAIALGLEAPQVLFSDDLEAIGRPEPVTDSAATMQGVPLSSGSAEGPALVLTDPDGAEPPGEPYVLVCPSTDPAWVPLFVRAKALVMETGGVLSHGAIVAREFGLPAVAGLSGVHQRLRTGQRLKVDGSTGRVTVLDTPA